MYTIIFECGNLGSATPFKITINLFGETHDMNSAYSHREESCPVYTKIKQNWIQGAQSHPRVAESDGTQDKHTTKISDTPTDRQHTTMSSSTADEGEKNPGRYLEALSDNN
jgi:hypothetical protein